jgi:uncharacterized spore protein YtfJ
MTELMDALERARETINIDHVFGEPIERDGVIIIPVARVTVGGGNGQGPGRAGGGGWGGRCDPVGAFAIHDGKVSFQPIVDVNKIIAGAYVVGIVGILGTPRIIRAAAKIVKAAG